ncbi:MAG: tetratricopeptide repeat protein [Chloroflexi bacterium]|nr:tetratricopeptide repeat protein [Chloroflexota bacterium]
MVQVIETGKLTPADELRELLDRVERRVANVSSASTDEVFELLEWLDRIVTLIEDLEADGMDLRPERTRLESVEGMVRSKAGIIVRKVKLGLAKRREEVRPDESHWWWWLDQYVLERTRARIRRIAITVSVVVILGAAAYLILTRLFPTDPRVEKAHELQLAAERMVMDGQWAEAEQQFLQALEYTPDDLMLWTWLGVVREEQGNQAGAEEAFARARQLADSEVEFLLARGQIYSQVREGEKAEADAKKAIELEPDSARAHFVLASAYEVLGKNYEAIQEFQKAADLAADKDPQLVVLARMRMGMLMQLPSAPFGTETVTATVPAP